MEKMGLNAPHAHTPPLIHTSLCACVTMRQAVKCQWQNTDERIRRSDVIVACLLHCWNSMTKISECKIFIPISLMNAAPCVQMEAVMGNVMGLFPFTCDTCFLFMRIAKQKFNLSIFFNLCFPFRVENELVRSPAVIAWQVRHTSDRSQVHYRII